MIKAIQKMRDWIIKKLGGYTANEYETINRIPFQPTTFDRRDVERLRIQLEINRYRAEAIQSSEFIKHELTRQLIPLVMERMKIKQINSYRYDTTVYEATIGVVRED